MLRQLLIHKQQTWYCNKEREWLYIFHLHHKRLLYKDFHHRMIHQMNMEGQGNWTSSALCQIGNQYLQIFNQLMNNMLLVQMNKGSTNMIKNDEAYLVRNRLEVHPSYRDVLLQHCRLPRPPGKSLMDCIPQPDRTRTKVSYATALAIIDATSHFMELTGVSFLGHSSMNVRTRTTSNIVT